MKIIKTSLITKLLVISVGTMATDYFALVVGKNLVVESRYGSDGFDKDGLHKDTGTLYDNEGYDQGGYSSGGTGRAECRPYDTQNYVRTNKQYSYYSNRY